MKRTDNTERVNEVISRLLKAYSLETKYHEAGLIQSWEKILGPAIGNRTHRIFIKDKKLMVELSSPALKQELSMARSRLVQLLNEQYGREVVNEVVFL